MTGKINLYSLVVRFCFETEIARGFIRRFLLSRHDGPNFYLLSLKKMTRRRRDLLNILTIKHCDKIEKFKTILVKIFKCDDILTFA